MATTSYTAVQLHDQSDFRSYLYRADIAGYRESSKGKFALLNQQQLALLILVKTYTSRAFLFRTNSGSTNAVAVPCIYPSVDLLVEVRTKTRVHRLRNVVRYMEKHHMDMAELPDEFFIWLQSRIEEKVFSHDTIREILDRCGVA